MVRYSAAMFDLDGTLLDTLGDLAGSVNEALERLGMPAHPVDAYRFFVGNGMLNLARRAAPAGTPDADVVALRDCFVGIYANRWDRCTRPYPGIESMLATLRGRGIVLSVLSNKPDNFTRLIIERFFGPDMFAVVRGARDDTPHKPDPTAARIIAKQTGIPPEETAYFGDSDTDMRTGIAAGMHTCGVAWGFRPRQELQQAGAHRVLDAPTDIVVLFGDA